MKKKILSLCLVLALGATAIIGGTLAYFTDKTETAQNTFTVGNVDITLTEPAWTVAGGGKEEGADVYPGEALAKDPTVTNVGKNACFVRLSVTGLDQFVEEYGADAMITLRHGEYVSGYDTANWTKIGDYYYYNFVLTYPGDTWEGNSDLQTVTPPLFNQIVMPTQLTNNAATEPIEIFAEAVQAQGAQPSWGAVKAMQPADIAAWFNTCVTANPPVVD